jgi:spermidine/putrescine-binding protein
MKKLFLSVLLVLLLAACGGGPGGGPAADTEDSSSTDANGEVQLAEQLSVYNWSDYIDEAMITNGTRKPTAST